MPRYYFALYAYILSFSALISMGIHMAKWVDYPVRPFPYCLQMSLYLNGVIYPAMGFLYLYFSRHGRKLYWGSLIVLGFLLAVRYIFRPLKLIEYNDWNDFNMLLVVTALLLTVELFLRFYRRMAGELG